VESGLRRIEVIHKVVSNDFIVRGAKFRHHFQGRVATKELKCLACVWCQRVNQQQTAAVRENVFEDKQNNSALYLLLEHDESGLD
jgi:formate hydrogenlyase subunit 6/NADH:ubiquinone oxidoreductase subunit I